MKIGLVGNMNNNFFAVARYLRDRGHDAEVLLLNDEQRHFLPENDTFLDDFRSYTTALSWGDAHSFYRTPSKRIRKDLEPYDFLIVCGSVPAFLARIGRRADVFMPYGGDLHLLPYARKVRRPRDLLRNAYRTVFRRYQRRGIRECELISQELFIPLTLRWLERLGVADRNYYLGFPMVYDGELRPERIEQAYPRSRTHAEFRKIRDEHGLVVFHHARHLWKTFAGDNQLKNNHHLILGFADLVRERHDLDPCLVLFEYGANVAESRALIRELGIEGHVRWFPILPRKEIQVGLSLCDIGAGEFCYGFFGGGVMWEILLSGKPLLSYRDDALLDGRATYPLINARTREDIARELLGFARDRAPYDAVGRAGRQWTVDFFRHSVDALEELCEAGRRGGDLRAVAAHWRDALGRRSILDW